MDKVDNQTIECMVCARCTFKGEKRQEEWEIGGDSGEAERVMRERVEEERNGIVEKFREKSCRQNSRINVQTTIPARIYVRNVKITGSH